MEDIKFLFQQDTGTLPSREEVLENLRNRAEAIRQDGISAEEIWQKAQRYFELLGISFEEVQEIINIKIVDSNISTAKNSINQNNTPMNTVSNGNASIWPIYLPSILSIFIVIVLHICFLAFKNYNVDFKWDVIECGGEYDYIDYDSRYFLLKNAEFEQYNNILNSIDLSCRFIDENNKQHNLKEMVVKNTTIKYIFGLPKEIEFLFFISYIFLLYSIHFKLKHMKPSSNNTL